MPEYVLQACCDCCRSEINDQSRPDLGTTSCRAAAHMHAIHVVCSDPVQQEPPVHGQRGKQEAWSNINARQVAAVFHPAYC